MLNLIRFNTPWLKATPYCYLNAEAILEIDPFEGDKCVLHFRKPDGEMASWLIEGDPKTAIKIANDTGVFNCVPPEKLKPHG